MLLTHTSSIRDNWSFMFYYYHSDPPLALGDYLDDYFTPDSQYYSLQNFYNYTPGSSYAYCNIGFALAGYLVEAITGTEVSQYCKDSLFTSLGMNESSFFYRDLDTMHMAMPYKWNSNYFTPYGHYSYHDYPAGALKTSTVQLAGFLIAFMQYGKFGNMRILDSITVKLMITPQVPSINPGQGLCWYKLTLGTRELWGHHGGDYGIRTGMFFCPADTTGILVFTNGDSQTDPIMNEMFNYASNYPISIHPISTNIASHFSLYQNYPNPFNPATKIKFDIALDSRLRGNDNVTLKIFDILGREIAVLVNDQLKHGTYEVEWDASNFSSGVYFYKLEAGEFTETRKMIMVK
jgi:CubicO group peptidase (beta-lactamase class C family)